MTPSPLRGRWLWLTLAVIALDLLFLRLGVWQLQRLSERRVANARIVARTEQPALSLTDAPLDPAEADLRRAVVAGIYDPAHEIVLRNRTYNELPGVHVLTPLRIAGSDAAVLVDRGWIPYDDAAPDRRKVFAPLAGPVEVHGVLRAAQQRVSSLSPADVTPPGGATLDAWHRVDLSRIQAQMPYPLLPVFLEEEPGSPSVSSTGFPRPLPNIALSEGTHLGYAIQWFAFAAILAGGYIILCRSRLVK
jgi:surfeit locus 1 family protein